MLGMFIFPNLGKGVPNAHMVVDIGGVRQGVSELLLQAVYRKP